MLAEWLHAERADVTQEEYRLREDHGVELLQDLLYSFLLDSRTFGQATLYVYRLRSELGQRMWDRSLRCLRQVASRPHDALPRLIDGGRRVGPDQHTTFGYVITSRARRTAADRLDYIRRNSPAAVRNLIRLLDGLQRLHSAGILHRAIGPAAIEDIDTLDDPSDGLHLCLARFEASVIVPQMLRTGDEARVLERDALRALVREQGLPALICMPPERLAMLFPRQVPGEHATVEQFSGDVYSLGILALQWFLPPLKEEELRAVFPGTVDGGLRLNWSQWSRLHGRIVRDLRSSRHLPRPLVAALLRTLNPVSRFRPTAGEVANELAQRLDQISAWFEGREQDRPHLVAYHPEEFVETAYNWKWIGSDPRTKEGAAQLREFLARDLASGVLRFAPGGWAEIKAVKNKEQASYCYVLLGQKGAYFCRPFRSRQGNVPLDEVLRLGFTLRLDGALARRLRTTRVQERLPAIEFVHWMDGRLTPDGVLGLPSWRSRLQTVRTDAHLVTPTQAIQEGAFQWLLDYEDRQILARTYAFTSKGPKGRGLWHLTFDKERDDAAVETDDMLNLLARGKHGRRRRPPFAWFFGNLEDYDLSKTVYWSATRDGRKTLESEPGRGVVVEVHGEYDVLVRPDHGVPLPPEQGWLFPEDNFSARTVRWRQEDALVELRDNATLLDHLWDPSSMLPDERRWKGARTGLKNESFPPAIVEMLDSGPLYALHGPPGTGKTTLVAHALYHTLLHDIGARILVSAQAHYALDNLAKKVMEVIGLHDQRLRKAGVAGPLLGDDLTLLRVASRDARDRGKVDEDVEHLLDDRLLDDTLRRIRQNCKEIRSHNLRGYSPGVLMAVAAWLDAVGPNVGDVAPSALELLDRLRRGANVVFATCATATPHLVGARTASSVFDLVVVEEAAKAWPTELMVPLVRGRRWILVGDHLQLEAFGFREVMDLLQEGANAGQTLGVAASLFTQYKRAFELFKSLLVEPKEEAPAAEAGGAQAANVPRAVRLPDTMLYRPVGRLTRQFRMAKPIAAVVSEVFYGGELDLDASPDTPHGLHSPPGIVGRSLVWVDTANRVECEELPQWKNEGEALLVQRIVAAIGPKNLKTTDPDHPRCVVLSPYNEQNARLTAVLAKLDSALGGLVRTIDAWQGREADIVIVSMVRSRTRNLDRIPKESRARQMLGHTADPHRLNVMLSRAKQLLVIVGERNHFLAAGDDTMTRVLRKIEEHGTFLSVAELFGEEAGP